MILSYLTTVNNNVINAIIDLTSNELAYEFRVNDTFAMLENLSTKNYSRFRQVKRKSIEKVITFVNVMKKLRYDIKHIELKLAVKKYAYLCFYNDYIIFDLINRKLNQQRIKFFEISKKIETLTYRFKLSSIMQIHSMIFIIQLKSTSALDIDLYRRSRFDVDNSSSMQLKNDSDSKNSTKLYEIKRLLNRRIIFIDRISYLMK